MTLTGIVIVIRTELNIKENIRPWTISTNKYVIQFHFTCRHNNQISMSWSVIYQLLNIIYCRVV